MSNPSTSRKKTSVLSNAPVLVGDLMVLTAPVVSYLFVLPGWSATVTKAKRGDVVALTRKDCVADSEHIPVHDVRTAFETVKTIEDAVGFFERYGPLDDRREYVLSHISAMQEWLKVLRQMDSRDFFGLRKDLQRWYDASPLPAQLMMGRRPFWSLETFDVQTAIRTATFIDHMRGVRAGTCRQCGMLFELPLRRKQIYCDSSCQTKAGKKRWNEKQARVETKG